MGDAFRNELEAAHEQVRRKDERIRELEEEKELLKLKLAADRPSPVPYVFGGLVFLLFVAGVLAMFMRAAPAGTTTGNVEPPASTNGRAFDRGSAAEALRAASADLHACYTDARPISFHAVVVFGRSGKVESFSIDDPSGLSAEESACVSAKVSDVTVPAFDGPSVRVGKTFTNGPDNGPPAPPPPATTARPSLTPQLIQ